MAREVPLESVGAVGVPSRRGFKRHVCIAFFEHGTCPYKAHCLHGHDLGELDPETQSKLLAAVPMERIPTYFLPVESSVGLGGASRTKSNSFADADARPETAARRASNSHVAQYGLTDTFLHKAAQRGSDSSDTPHPTQCGAAHATSHSASQSSHTSSNGSALISAAGWSKTASTPLHDSSRLSLPPRCRYPHRDISGTYYDVLGILPTATQEAIMASYRRWQREAFNQLKQVDPVSAEAINRLVVEARNVLCTTTLRQEYDRLLRSNNAIPWAAFTDFTSDTSCANTPAGQQHVSGILSASPAHSGFWDSAVSSSSNRFSIRASATPGASICSNGAIVSAPPPFGVTPVDIW